MIFLSWLCRQNGTTQHDKKNTQSNNKPHSTARTKCNDGTMHRCLPANESLRKLWTTNSTTGATTVFDHFIFETLDVAVRVAARETNERNYSL